MRAVSDYEEGQACMEACADAIVNHREKDWSHELIEKGCYRSCVVIRP
jgi:hypothetical protein